MRDCAFSLILRLYCACARLMRSDVSVGVRSRRTLQCLTVPQWELVDSQVITEPIALFAGFVLMGRRWSHPVFSPESAERDLDARPWCANVRYCRCAEVSACCGCALGSFRSGRSSPGTRGVHRLGQHDLPPLRSQFGFLIVGRAAACKCGTTEGLPSSMPARPRSRPSAPDLPLPSVADRAGSWRCRVPRRGVKGVLWQQPPDDR
jgi:hypothetical protein